MCDSTKPSGGRVVSLRRASRYGLAGHKVRTARAWDFVFGSSVKGAFFQVQALAPLVNRGAAIEIIGSKVRIR